MASPLQAQINPPGMVSGAAVGSASGSAGSFAPVLSADGESIAFVSLAADLVPGLSSDGVLNVFVRRPNPGSTVLVSANRMGTRGGNADSAGASISADGSMVVFESFASDLVEDDSNGARDVFARNLATGETKLVSRRFDGNSSANAASKSPALSQNGRYVVFLSDATDLVQDDATNVTGVFWHDLESGETRRISPDGPASSCALSANGAHVVFRSHAESGSRIYLWKSDSESIVEVSAGAPEHFEEVFECSPPVISEDGGVVAFVASDPGQALLFRFKSDSGELELVGDQIDASSAPGLNANGSAMVYGAHTSSNPAPQIYLRTEAASARALVSATADGLAGAGRSYAPAISANGREIVFISVASNLVTGAVPPFPQAYLRNLNTEETRLISRTSSGQAAGRAGVAHATISRNGTAIVFDSASPDLVAGDLNDHSDIFLNHLTSDNLELVSVRDGTIPPQSAPGFHLLPFAHMSDGRFVVFSSTAANLVPGDTNGVEDVFLRDLWAGSTTLVSANPDTGVPGNGRSWAPLLSGNGRYVVFISQATNLHNVNQAGTGWGVLRKDLLLNEIRGIHHGTNITTIGSVSYRSESSLQAWTISHSGQRVLFMPKASIPDLEWLSSGNIISAGGGASLDVRARAPILISSNGAFVVVNAAGTSSFFQVFQHNFISAILVSANESGAPFAGHVQLDALSADDRFIAFSVTNAVYLHEIATRTNHLICTDCASAALSEDAGTVAYRKRVDGRWQIENLHVASGERTPISVTRTGLDFGNADSGAPLITPGGRYVIFSSRASDLVENDHNNLPDVFVRDTLLQRTMLVSLNKEGTASGAGSSTRPVLASDGRTVLFYSFASDLVANDQNLSRDIFALRLGSIDSDSDGMDDDWEMAYFGNLDRDGTGDFDGDGHTDLEEFLAGTDPTDANSILRAMLLLAPDGTATVLWHSVPGKRYRVEFKDGVDEGEWNELPGVITASGPSASVRDESDPTTVQRFYRVVVLE